MNILDLGCGTAKVSGAVGLDVIPLPGVDVLVDLKERPYPFPANTFDAVYLNDVIEHIPDTIATMEEIHRLLRPDGRVYIRVVNWNSHYTAMDPTHVRAFTEHSFDFFGKRQGRSYYSAARFDVLKVDKQYNARVLRWIPSQRSLDFLSQYLNNILEGLHFELRAVKETGEMTYPGDVQQNLLAALRCPACLAEHAQDGSPDPGKLQAVENGRWLVCQDAYCGRKYPVADGLPVLTSKEGKRWQAYAVKELPEPPEDYTCIPAEVTTGGEVIFARPPETIDRILDQLQRKRSLAAFSLLTGLILGILLGRGRKRSR
jgi:uncharacterized protein YbaR (Trm112 family)